MCCVHLLLVKVACCTAHVVTRAEGRVGSCRDVWRQVCHCLLVFRCVSFRFIVSVRNKRVISCCVSSTGVPTTCAGGPSGGEEALRGRVPATLRHPQLLRENVPQRPLQTCESCTTSGGELSSSTVVTFPICAYA